MALDFLPLGVCHVFHPSPAAAAAPEERQIGRENRLAAPTEPVSGLVVGLVDESPHHAPPAIQAITAASTTQTINHKKPSSLCFAVIRLFFPLFILDPFSNVI
jgi:hypothetical protein